MKAVILAGGRGSRIEEESVTRPKPLVEIGEHPILWHIMNIYAAHGISEFIVCAGYKGARIKEYFANLLLYNGDITVDLTTKRIRYHDTTILDWKVTVVDTGIATNTGGRVGRIRHLLGPDEPFCLTYGDGVADIDIGALIAFHAKTGLDATVTTVVPPARFGAVDIDGDRVTAFREKPASREGRINGGFFVVHPRVLGLIEGDEASWEADVLSPLAESGRLAAYRHDGFWQPMDTLREKNLLEALWARGDAPWRIWR
jgi:glucose-1-phosphate cytidylyltransferase